MRMRKLLIATMFAGGALFLTPGIAAAQEAPTVKLPEANEQVEEGCADMLPKVIVADCSELIALPV